MAFPPVPFQEWFLRQTGAGNAALNAYVARVKADGGVVEAIGCVPLAVWDWAAPSFVGLLDLFPNAAAAYSLRKLRAAYSGSAVRVRKEVSSVSSETDIGFLADGSLDTVSLLAFASDADSGDVFVVTWYDQSLSNDATQSAGASQPKIVSGGSLVTENGKAAVDFDVIGKSFKTTLASVISQPNTFFIVHKYDNYLNSLSTNIIDSAPSSDRQLIDTSGTSYRIFAGSSVTPVSASNNQSLITVLFNGSASEFSLNGANNTGLNCGVNGLDTFDIDNYEGIIQEFFIYPSDQSANRTAIESNQANFYGITI